MTTIDTAAYAKTIAVMALQIADAKDDATGNAMAGDLLNVAHVLHSSVPTGVAPVAPAPVTPAVPDPRLPTIGGSSIGDPSGGAVPVERPGSTGTVKPGAPGAPSGGSGGSGSSTGASGGGSTATGDATTAAELQAAASAVAAAQSSDWSSDEWAQLIAQAAENIEAALDDASNAGDTWFPAPSKTVNCTKSFRTAMLTILPQIRALAAKGSTASQQQIIVLATEVGRIGAEYVACMKKPQPIS